MKQLLKLPLQFFAEPAPEPEPQPEPENALAAVTRHYEEELATRDAKIKDLEATISVLCGGKPAPTPGEPEKNTRKISPTLKALLR